MCQHHPAAAIALKAQCVERSPTKESEVRFMSIQTGKAKGPQEKGDRMTKK